MAADLCARLQCAVLVYDHRGMGQSADHWPAPTASTPPAMTLSRLAQDAYALAATVFPEDITSTAAGGTGPRRLHVLGISMGGMVAQLLAISHPNMVTSLILGCTSGGRSHFVPHPPEAEEQDFISVLASQPPVTNAAEKRAMYERTVALQFTRPWIGLHGTGAVFRQVVDTQLAARRPLKTIMAQMTAIPKFDTGDRLAQLSTVPVLVVHGTGDRVMPYGNGKVLAQRIPGARLCTLSDVGHMFWIQAPLDSVKQCADFMAAAVAAVRPSSKL
jgi:pimeloyl-ACP methyl ester carboxylesterase